MEKEESNVWFVMIVLIITYFSYRVTHIFIILTTERCVSQEIVWLSSNFPGLSLFTMFLTVFLLIGVWAIVELIRAFVLSYRDRFVCLLVTALVLFAVSSVVLISTAQYQSYQVIYGGRTYDEFTFKIVKQFYLFKDSEGVIIDGKYKWQRCIN